MARADIDHVLDELGNVQYTRNIQQSECERQAPCGAVVRFKEQVNVNDKYVVFEVNGRNMNDQPAYIFKSHSHMAQLGVDMDKDWHGILKDEHCFDEAVHDRVCNYKTITVWTFHPSCNGR